jgi:nicotinamide riboside kinase
MLKNSIDEGRYDYYLLCSPVTPWKQDGIRGDIMRPEEMHLRFQMELVNRNLCFCLIEGAENERYEMAVKAISAWILKV